MDNKQKKLLVVEDEEYLRELYVEILEQEGYTVESAADGEQGYDLMHKGGYDLVLLDIMLPKMDGFQILEKLHQNSPEKPNGGVIVLTNLGKDTNVAQGISLGISGYLMKAENTPDQVLNEVKNFLKT